jgi:pilus assembly protein Flp/PilA
MSALNRIKSFLADESGPTAVEYAVMLALILVACISIVGTLGKSANSTFTTVNSALGAGSAS